MLQRAAAAALARCCGRVLSITLCVCCGFYDAAHMCVYVHTCIRRSVSVKSREKLYNVCVCVCEARERAAVLLYSSCARYAYKGSKQDAMIALDQSALSDFIARVSLQCIVCSAIENFFKKNHL